MLHRPVRGAIGVHSTLATHATPGFRNHEIEAKPMIASDRAGLMTPRRPVVSD